MKTAFNKIVVLDSESKIRFWDDEGQSPSAINMAGYIFVGYTNKHMEFKGSNLRHLKSEMEQDIKSGEYNKWGGGTIRDWATGKYNLL